jgi:uncharacterized iron-regulated membrane protein
VTDPLVRGRALTLFAVGFLVLDGVLLLFAGVWGRQLGPAIGGLCCFAAAGGVLQLWRRHRRAVADLAEARRAVQEEARALRELVRRHSGEAG